MAENDPVIPNNAPDNKPADARACTDITITCIDCSQDFLWSEGEQTFYLQKGLQNPPKRCKPCKQAKTRRLADIEMAQVTGKKHRIDIRAVCAECSKTTTVPFFPSQGRPVYCRECYDSAKGFKRNKANA